jgi:hypothetical protein
MIDAAGKQKTVKSAGYDKVYKLIGEAMKNVLLQAQKDGVFAHLIKADGCELLVEHFDGLYSWPTAKGKKNLV